MEIPPVEMQTIKGITGKLLVTICLCTISITGAVLGTYYSLKSEMEKTRVDTRAMILDESHQREMDGLQMKEFRIRLDALEVKVDQLRMTKQ